MEALAGIGKEQYSKAYDIRQKELDLEEAQRQAELQRKAEMDMFYAKLAADQAAQAAASRGSGGGGGGIAGISGLYGASAPTKAGTQSAAAKVAVNPSDQILFNQMFIKSDGTRWDDNALRNDYNATLASARRGNARDIQKIRLYHAARKDLFGAQAPIPTGAIRPASTGTRTALPTASRTPTSNLLRPFGF